MSRDEFRELKKVREYIYNCKKCGVCAGKVTNNVPYVCPVKKASPGFEHFSSRGKTIIAQSLIEGGLEPNPELAQAAYSCTLCGNCMTQCGSIDHDTGMPLVKTNRIVEALRADLLREHPEWVEQSYRSMISATRQYDNPWGQPRAAKERWAKGLELADAQKRKAEVLLYVGCTMAVTPALAVRARKAARILQACEADFAVLGRHEPCCGSVQRRVGDVDLAATQMNRNVELFNSLGCKQIITLCAGCYHTLKKDYEEAGAKLVPEVYHLSEYLAKIITDKKPDFSDEESLTIAYHDPCHLGRHMGVFDAPRDVLKALPGVTLVERRATRQNTICCGAGGGMRLFGGGEMAADIGVEAVKAAADVGAQAIVSACPFCEMNLDAAASRLEKPLPVLDIIDLTAARLGIQE